MKYRKANLEDITQLVELRKKQLIDEGSHADTDIDGELEKYFTTSITNGDLFVWLAVENDNIIGTAAACYFQYPPNFSNPTGRTAYITNVYTKDEYRNQGIATKLLEFVFEELKNKDCKFLRLHASAQGKKLYEKMGFVDAEGIMNMRIE